MNSKKTFINLTIALLCLHVCIVTAHSQSLGIDPSPAYVGRIPIGSSEILNLLIVNHSINTINISSITMGGEAADKFSIIDNPAPYGIPGFDQLILRVEYTPTIPGEDEAILQLETGSGGMNVNLTAYGHSIINGLPTFERLIGLEDDKSESSIAQTADGGFVIVGTIELVEHINQDILIVKTDKYGKIEWQKSFEPGASGGSYDSGDDHGVDVIPLSDGSIIVIGDTESMGPGNFSHFLSKWDASGNFIWEKAYGGTFADKPTRAIQDSRGDIVIVGSTQNTPDGTENVHVLKFDPNDETLIWENNYGEGGGIQSGYDIVETPDGGYIIVGNNQQQGQTANLYILKIAADGSKQWSKTFVSDRVGEGNRIQNTSDGGYIISGFILTETKGMEGYLVKVDSNAELQWSKTFGTEHPDRFSSVVQMPDDGYLCVGAINQFWSIDQSYDDLWLLKTDVQGNFEWEKRFGGELSDSGTDMIKTKEGGYAIIGRTGSFSILEDRIYFLQVNADGLITKVAGGNKEAVPDKFGLLQNYPNPFNPATTIEFSLRQKQEVTLKVYDLLGREVTILVNTELGAGVHKVTFDASNLPSGVYIYRLQGGEFTKTKKMVFIK